MIRKYELLFFRKLISSELELRDDRTAIKNTPRKTDSLSCWFFLSLNASLEINLDQPGCLFFYEMSQNTFYSIRSMKLNPVFTTSTQAYHETNYIVFVNTSKKPIIFIFKTVYPFSLTRNVNKESNERLKWYEKSITRKKQFIYLMLSCHVWLYIFHTRTYSMVFYRAEKSKLKNTSILFHSMVIANGPVVGILLSDNYSFTPDTL